jgi:Domain of unknown function (DUF5058)
MNLLSLYIIGIILIVYVLVESALFYKKAYDKGLEIGITKRQLFESTRFSILFSLVPSIPILIGLVTMIPLFGDVIVPWIRLSVVGSVSYETYAALAIKNGAQVTSLFEDLQVYSTALWTMTVSIMSGAIILLFFYRAYQNKLTSIREKDAAWSKVLIAAMFMGLVSTIGAQQITLGGYNALALLISMMVMAIFGTLSLKFKWMEEFALPLSILLTLLAMYWLLGV